MLTAGVGVTGFCATLSNHISLAVFLGPALTISEGVTVGIFLLGLGLHLGALLISRGSPGASGWP